MDNDRLRIIISSVFFVLGFSAVFSVLGVLLQGALSSVAYDTRNILGYIGGIIIIFFGLLMMGVIRIGALEAEHKFRVKRTKFQYLSSFLFGGAFAIGWTPCVGAVLGTVLTLAVTDPASAFPMMLAYSLGLGIPFIIAAIFLSQITGLIKKAGPLLNWFNLVFGAIIVLLGILVFTNSLSSIASFAPVEALLFSSEIEIGSGGVNILIAFLAGIVSFLSPCILPLIPAYLTFIAGMSVSGTAKG